MTYAKDIFDKLSTEQKQDFPNLRLGGTVEALREWMQGRELFYIDSPIWWETVAEEIIDRCINGGWSTPEEE